MQQGPEQPEITAQTATTRILDNILANSHQYPWLTAWAARNAVSIQTLIEADTFDERSDFQAQYPNAGLIDQLNILKAFIENTPLLNFDIPAITEMLKAFLDTIETRERNLETDLFTAQWHRETPWDIRLPTNLRASLKLLDELQVLNYIEAKIVGAPREEQRALQEILQWAQAKRATLGSQVRPPSYTQSEYAYFFGGAGRFNQLARNEINAFIRLWHRIKSTVRAVATFNRFPLGSLLLDGFLITLNLGLTFLLPWRLALTACREGRYFVQRTINRMGHYLTPNNRAVQTCFSLLSLLIGVYLILQYFPYFSLKMLLGLKFFPDAWSFSFIFSLSLGFSASELIVGAALGIGQRIIAFVRRENAPEHHDPLALNVDDRQRIALLRVLNTRLGEGVSAQEREEIGAELIALNNRQQPYPLSQFDLGLLRQHAQTHDNALPESFEPARDRIFPRLNPV